MSSPAIDRPVVHDAWRESCLADVPRPVADRLLDGSRLLRVATGDDPGGVALAVVVDGLLRIFRTGPDGRQVTVRYVSSGGFVGLAAVLGGSWSAASLAAEALRDSTLLELRPDRFEAAIRDEPAVAAALCRYLFHELVEAQQTLSADLMLPVRSRVACHLLNLAEREERELVVRATPQHLAAAVGSVREVVSRVLRHMEQIGLVQRRAGQLVLVDCAGLHRIWAGESGL
jgi:CRP/FNR family transcriptional regulator, cyclic AMP receptor protein